MEDNIEKNVEEEVKEEKVVENKKGNGLGKFLLIIVVLLLGIGIGFGIKTYLDSLKENKEKEPAEVQENTPKEEKKLENLLISDERVTQAMKNFEALGIDAAKKYGYEIKNVTVAEIINTGIGQLKKEQINYCTAPNVSITIDDFNKALHEILPNKKVSIQDIKDNKSEGNSYIQGEYEYSHKSKDGSTIAFSFKISDDKLYVLGPCGFEGPYSNQVRSKVEKAEANDTNLYVYERVAFGNSVKNNGKMDFYSDKNYENKVEEFSVDTEPSDWTKYKTYKLTFEKSDGKYLFVSSELAD